MLDSNSKQIILNNNTGEIYFSWNTNTIIATLKNT